MGLVNEEESATTEYKNCAEAYKFSESTHGMHVTEKGELSLVIIHIWYLNYI